MSVFENGVRCAVNDDAITATSINVNSERIKTSSLRRA
jgi:hypothetical protein